MQPSHISTTKSTLFRAKKLRVPFQHIIRPGNIQPLLLQQKNHAQNCQEKENNTKELDKYNMQGIKIQMTIFS